VFEEGWGGGLGKGARINHMGYDISTLVINYHIIRLKVFVFHYKLCQFISQ